MAFLKSKEQFAKDYQVFVLEALSILKRFPECAYSCSNREKKIKDAPDIFQEETLILLESLKGFYDRIIILPNDSAIEGLTKKLLISYFDRTKGYKGIKAGGRYIVSIVLNEIEKAYPHLLSETVIVKRPRKKQKSDTLVSKAIHPHVSNFKVCWSGMKETINDFLQKARFLEVFLCTCQFLCYANLESCYIKEEFLGWQEIESCPNDSSIAEIAKSTSVQLTLFNQSMQ